MNWAGVLPAVTTRFNDDLSVDYTFVASHCRWMIDAGCTGIVALGSLGEGATLSDDEKTRILETIVEAVGDRVPVVAGISALSTAGAVKFAREAERSGCQGLMVLPPYVYSSDWREMKAHVASVIDATPLSCMLYNNPVAYKTDFLPEQIVELASEHSNLSAVKESSTDVRRISAIRALCGDRLQIAAGVDDVIVEAIGVGATGWIAGLVNAFPVESVKLFEWSLNGEHKKAFELYRWFLPLLRLDTVPKFVQLIKLTQAAVDMGSVSVRPPRLHLSDHELADANHIIEEALATRPSLT